MQAELAARLTASDKTSVHSAKQESRSALSRLHAQATQEKSGTHFHQTTLVHRSAIVPVNAPIKAANQLPVNSYLSRVLEDPAVDVDNHSSLGSEPSSPDSSDSEPSRKRKKKAKKQWKKKRDAQRRAESLLKPEPLFVYNGTPQYDLFQKWVYECKQYIQQGHVRLSRPSRSSGKVSLHAIVNDLICKSSIKVLDHDHILLV